MSPNNAHLYFVTPKLPAISDPRHAARPKTSWWQRIMRGR